MEGFTATFKPLAFVIECAEYIQTTINGYIAFNK